jgi:hypothetical protein
MNKRPLSMAERNKAAKKKFPESKGVAIARKARERCNDLNDAQRAELTLHAMRLIYGSDAVPANRS